jgi:Xaa-Pro aminopeptidase
MDAPSTSDTTATTAEPKADDTKPLDAPGNRKAPFPRGFLETISTGWAERPDTLPEPREQAAWAARRRARVSEAFRGQRVVVPAGGLKQRSNDTDYPFRAHSAFAHLTGWGRDAEPDAVLVFEPRDDGHEAVLYFRERADRTTAEFYSDAAVGEFWIGPRPALDGVAADLRSPRRTSPTSSPATTTAPSATTTTSPGSCRSCVWSKTSTNSPRWPWL